jgi:glycosyltransferase involved in cell wall biosynthesis
MDLSVIVCTYNRAALLGEALDALARQDVQKDIDWEIIIVDNNSQDQTREVIGAFARRCPIPATYVFEERQGLSYARNTAVASARGGVLAFTDDDVTPERGWVRAILQSLHRHQAHGVGGRVLPKWAQAPPAWLRDDRSLVTGLAMLASEEFARLEPGNGLVIYGANMAFRRELFGELGAFDSTLGRIGTKLYGHEETDFVKRALRAGKTIVYDPSLVVWHHVGPDRMRKRYFRKLSFDRAENHAMSHPRPGRSVLGVPFYMFRLTASHVLGWTLAILRGDPRAFVKETEIWSDVGRMCGHLRARSRQSARHRRA